jgi:SAM-dependent methyltransferase
MEMQSHKSDNSFNYCDEYNEQPHLWDKPLNDAEKERLSVTRSFIPKDVETILDVGCGDGRITNELAKYNIIGIDASREALKYVKTPKVLARIEQIPFQNKSFDLVLYTQVAEHLPNAILRKSIREVERVSKKYILLSVPFKENLYAGMTKCNNCGEVFHIYNHFQSFSKKRLASLFPGFKPVDWITFGPYGEYRNKLLSFLARLGGKWSVDTHTLCPKCGSKNAGTEQGNILSWVAERVNWRIGSIYPFKRKRWIAVLYEKSNTMRKQWPS